MGFRFYRRVKIAPGFTLNLSKRGASVSVGARGAHVTVGSTGTRATAGLPGTGLFYTKAQRWQPSRKVATSHVSPRRKIHPILLLLGTLWLLGTAINHAEIVVPILAGAAVFVVALLIIFHKPLTKTATPPPDLSYVVDWADQVAKFFPEDAAKLRGLVLQNKPFEEIKEQMLLIQKLIAAAQVGIEAVERRQKDDLKQLPLGEVTAGPRLL